MINGKMFIEVDPSGRTACSSCDRPLEKGSDRLVVEAGAGKWKKVKRYCPACGLAVLTTVVAYVEAMAKGLKGDTE